MDNHTSKNEINNKKKTSKWQRVLLGFYIVISSIIVSLYGLTIGRYDYEITLLFTPYFLLLLILSILFLILSAIRKSKFRLTIEYILISIQWIILPIFLKIIFNETCNCLN